MRTPDLAEKIVEATVGAAHVPVTVKIRKGFYAEDRNAATFAQMLEGAGAAAVAVHGRCATQLYTGQADWSVVDEVADAVEIPVIGSGDVFCAEDAAEHLRNSGASAVFNRAAVSTVIPGSLVMLAPFARWHTGAAAQLRRAPGRPA